MPKRLTRAAAIVVLAALIGWIAWNWSAWRAHARLGPGYGARMTCSCRYVEGRDMQSCDGDTEPGMWIVSIDDLPEERAVEASVPLLAERKARYRPGWGCLLDPL
jgi:hypothetical protein